MFGILRTILAINVILLHIFGIRALGNYSVHFFFVLSGFLMTYVMNENYQYGFKGFSNFWINRFLRLYPIYWIVLIICILLISIFPNVARSSMTQLPASIYDWFYNIFMIYPNRIPTRIEPKLIPSSWALTNELFYYLLISFGISKSMIRTLFWLAISIAYYIITYYYFNLDNYRYGAIPAASLPFAIGALLYWIKDLKIFKLNLWYIILLYTLFILNALYMSSLNPFLRQVSIYLNFLIAGLIVISLFHLKTENDKIKKADTYIGRYSYLFYISHETILILYLLVLNNYGLIVKSVKLNYLAFLPYFFILLIFSFLIIHFVDLKVDLLKSKFKK